MRGILFSQERAEALKVNKEKCGRGGELKTVEDSLKAFGTCNVQEQTRELSVVEMPLHRIDLKSDPTEGLGPGDAYYGLECC